MPDALQRCKSCDKSFDIVCKRAYAPSCELENECGCISADQVNAVLACSDFESEAPPNVVKYMSFSHILLTTCQNSSPKLGRSGKRQVKKSRSRASSVKSNYSSLRSHF